MALPAQLAKEVRIVEAVVRLANIEYADDELQCGRERVAQPRVPLTRADSRGRCALVRSVFRCDPTLFQAGRIARVPGKPLALIQREARVVEPGIILAELRRERARLGDFLLVARLLQSQRDLDEVRPATAVGNCVGQLRDFIPRLRAELELRLRERHTLADPRDTEIDHIRAAVATLLVASAQRIVERVMPLA